MTRLPPDAWRPTGVEDLEPAAWRALREPDSVCVVAGPGAGKTEFLAQRAVYLLQTGVCAPPFRILAISFKTDAADNLAARVRQRCPPELAGRFVSLTFDAFTKGLVDRFSPAIPSDWRPTRPYDVAFPTRMQIEGFLQTTLQAVRPAWRADIAAIATVEFEPRYVGIYRLPTSRHSPASGTEYAVDRWWAGQLRQGDRSSLTFVSLNRLAELLLRSHPRIARALRTTYPFVFVDEFQDTTYAQYDFLLSAFGGGGTVVTAVGDDKQRIMAWAGARIDAFEQFQADFGATRIPLEFNFRSSPDLVRIQHVVARALDPNVSETLSRVDRQVDGDVAQVWRSETLAAEAGYLADWLRRDMARREAVPRDYALLVRQKSDDYEAELSAPLAAAGLRMRNESHTLGHTTLQDLLADDLCRLCIAACRLGAARRDPLSWRLVSTANLSLRSADPGDKPACHKAERLLSEFLAELRREMAALPPSPENAAAIAAQIFAFFDLTAVRRTYMQYVSGDLLEIMVEAFGLHLSASAEDAVGWTECLDAFEGVTQIPLMTVHKSKGLEYDTVIFIGLDDQAWWSHRRGDQEGLSTFFVALSRAKQRAIFLFCEGRGQRRNVGEFYQLLSEAGVPEIVI